MADPGYRLRTRSRAIPNPIVHHGTLYRLVGGSYVPWDPPSPVAFSPVTDVSFRQITEDEVHRWPKIRDGGPFKSVKVELADHEVRGVRAYDSGNSTLNGYRYQYRGGFTPVWPIGFGDPSLDTLQTGNLFVSQFLPSTSTYEPQVYPRLRPQISSAGAAVFIAELRDAPRMLRTTSLGFHDLWKTIRQADDFRFGASEERIRRLRRSARMGPKKAADQYLNQAFGWTPFLSDMNKFTKTFIQEGERIARLTRENNTWIKRKWVHDEINSDDIVGSGDGLRVVPFGIAFNRLCTADADGNLGHWTLRKINSTLVWSEGSFRYYRPEFDITSGDYFSTFSHIRRLMTLYGIRVNPSVIYQATPWSWAIDYVTNVGDHIDRITDAAFDSVTARYVYLMHHSVTRYVFTQVLNTKTYGPVSISWERSFESKQRKKADSPYGFSMPWDTLTPRQLSIAAALGISRIQW